MSEKNAMYRRAAVPCRLGAALLCGGMAMAAAAGEWLIPSPADGNEAAVAALTNALANCAEKDVVTLAKGVYDLSGVVSATDGKVGDSHLAVGKKTIRLRGDPSATRDEVVLQGGGARILCLGKARSWIENLTMANGRAQKGVGGAIVVTEEGVAMGAFCYLTNCVFRGNVSSGTDGAGVVAGATMYGCLAESNVAEAGAAGALKYGHAFDTVFRDNRATTGGACHQVILSRCLLEGNVSMKGCGGAVAYYCAATNCTFRYNAATNYPGGALENGRALIGCTFVGNMGTGNGGALYNQEGVVSNCWFESNWVKEGGSQGAIHAKADKKVVVQDCMFTNNASGWSSGVGSGVSVWSNCVFVGNSMRADNGKVAGATGGTYYNCTFRDQWSTTASYRLDPTNVIPRATRWWGALAVSGGTLFDCTVEGCVTNCALTRCTLADTTNLPVVAAASCALTNCLVVGNRLARDASGGPQGIFYAGAGGTPPTLVNCTVVGNEGTLFKMPGGAAVNTLFSGNTAGDGTAADISGGGTADAPLALDHCLYQTCTVPPEAIAFSDCVALAAGEGPKFNAGHFADYPYYMPRHTSKAVDAGVALGWDADAVDRGGYPRVSGRTVDIGCYEAWLPQNGSLLIVR